jgi:hypothetical protein
MKSKPILNKFKLGSVTVCLVLATAGISACSAHHIQSTSAATSLTTAPVSLTADQRNLNTTSLLYVEIDNDETQSGRNHFQTVPLLPDNSEGNSDGQASLDPKFMQQVLVELEGGTHRIVIIDSIEITN